ncbi:DUF3945 domain-containing protein [Maribellus comscasis]|uniref:DUF3945 domain-containing protein n=1 Tax=Maribellus comscasis TaxID=2681766 RepID=A0A6I6K2X9_9BACT|nr:DUF3945 domain-containing protein [Maribellus comscasis]QGY47770.1 DUF3945 domain-containing protein [Maribellus comscasis]
MEQNTRIKKDEIPFNKLEKVGVKKDFVNHMDENELRDFLNGFRSQKLYTINATVNDQQMRIPAKLRLKKEEDGTVNVKVHPIQRLQIPEEYMGHKFTQEERNRLLAERNLGKTIELTGRDGKKDKYYLALDPKTNELVPLRTKHITVPEKIKGVTLSAEQKQKLAKGEKVYLDKMTGRNGKKFGAALQVDAANRTINFSGFKQEKELDQKQTKGKGAKQKVN